MSIFLKRRELWRKYFGHKYKSLFFHNRTLHFDIIKLFYLPTDAQENCFKNNIIIYIKTAPTCFGAITIIRERIFELAKVTVVNP